MSRSLGGHLGATSQEEGHALQVDASAVHVVLLPGTRGSSVGAVAGFRMEPQQRPGHLEASLCAEVRGCADETRI